MKKKGAQQKRDQQSKLMQDARAKKKRRLDEDIDSEEDEPEPPPKFKRKAQKGNSDESSSEEKKTVSRSGRIIKKKTYFDDDDDFEDEIPLKVLKKSQKKADQEIDKKQSKEKNGGDAIEFINIEKIFVKTDGGSDEDEDYEESDEDDDIDDEEMEEVVKRKKPRASSSKKAAAASTSSSKNVPHIVKKAGGVTVYQCSKCPKTYARPSRLRRHFRKHTGDVRVRWFNCNICQKQFSTEDKLSKHIVRRHKESVNTVLDAVAVRDEVASAQAAAKAAEEALVQAAAMASPKNLITPEDEDEEFKPELVQVKVENFYDSYDEEQPIETTIIPKTEVDVDAPVKLEDRDDDIDDYDHFGDHFGDNYDDADEKDEFPESLNENQETFNKSSSFVSNKSRANDSFNDEKLPMVSENDFSGSEIIDCSPLGRDANDFLVDTEIESLSPIMFDEHEDDNPRSRLYKCSYCPRTFVVRENFANHMVYHTKKEKPFPCEQCDEQFLTQGTLHYHIESKHLRPRCEVCHEETGNLKDFLKHQRMHTKRIRYKYVCELCEERFPLKPQLKKHKEELHGTGHLKCAHCPMTFSNAVFFLCHATEFHGDPKPFRCDFCSFRTNKVNHQAIHLRTHLNEFPYRCLDCVKLFREEKDLMEHMKDHEENKVTKYKCDKCGKCFSTNSNLHRHMKKYCKMFKCPSCDKVFSTQQSLRQHQICHSDERPFKCDVCGQAFARPEAAKIHMRIHTNDRPFPCRICGRTFISSSRRGNHEKYHLGETLTYKCRVCKMGFTQAKDRDEHFEVHKTRKRTLQCAMCDQKFLRKPKLARHLKLHLTIDGKRNLRKK